MATIDTKRRESFLAQKRSEIEKWKKYLSHCNNVNESRHIQEYIDELEEKYSYYDRRYFPTVEEARELYNKVVREDYPYEY